MNGVKVAKIRLGEEIDAICGFCKIGKNSNECMKILKGLSDTECLLQKAEALKYNQGLKGVELERAIAEEMRKAGYKYDFKEE